MDKKIFLSCELWIGTNDFNTKKNFLVRSNPQIIFLSGNEPLVYDYDIFSVKLKKFKIDVFQLRR